MVSVCKHKCFLASMFYQNIGPSSVHVFHMYGVYFSSKKTGHFLDVFIFTEHIFHHS
jgi:hypothetical protein